MTAMRVVTSGGGATLVDQGAARRARRAESCRRRGSARRPTSPQSRSDFGPERAGIGSAVRRPEASRARRRRAARSDPTPSRCSPASRRAQRGGVLAQQRHRRLDARADLAHPLLDAMADPDEGAVGKHPLQRRQLHRGDGDVAQRHGQQADADPQALGPGQRRRRAWRCRPRGSSPPTARAPRDQRWSAATATLRSRSGGR